MPFTRVPTEAEAFARGPDGLETPGAEVSFAAQLAALEARLVPMENSLEVHVRSHGALGDGSDESAKIDAASLAVSAAGGGIVKFGPKTYRANVIARPNVLFVGEGTGKTILKAVAGSNTDVIKGLNFATLTGKTKATGDYALGCYEFGVDRMTIDGDKATQSSGYGIRIWGRAPFIGDVVIRNCKSGGFWSEFTEVDSFTDPAQVLEGHARHLEITACDGHGWVHRGPHDFTVGTCEIWNNTGHALRIEALAVDGTTYNGGAVFGLLNEYLNGNGVYFDGSQFECHGGQITCNGSAIGLESTATTGGMKIDETFFGGPAAGTNVGIHLRGSGHQISGEVSRSGVGVKLDGAIGCRLDLRGSANTAAINVVSEGGPNFITGLFDVPGGGALTSGAAFNSGGMYMLKGYGGVTASVQQFPSATLSAAGWSPQLPASNNVMRVEGTQTLTYGTSIATNHALAEVFIIVVSDGVGFTIALPTNIKSKPLVYVIQNNTAGAMGAITWNGIFKLNGAFTGPAAGKFKVIEFVSAGGWLLEKCRGGDV